MMTRTAAQKAIRKILDQANEVEKPLIIATVVYTNKHLRFSVLRQIITLYSVDELLALIVDLVETIQLIRKGK